MLLFICCGLADSAPSWGIARCFALRYGCHHAYIAKNSSFHALTVVDEPYWFVLQVKVPLVSTIATIATAKLAKAVHYAK